MNSSSVLQLPDLFGLIMQYFPCSDLMEFHVISKTWEHLMKNVKANTFWKRAYVNEWPHRSIDSKNDCWRTRLIQGGNFQSKCLEKKLQSRILCHGLDVWNLSLQESQLATASADHTVKVWNLDAIEETSGEAESIHKLEGHVKQVGAVEFLGPNRLLSGADDARIILWDLTSGSCIRDLKGHEGYIWALASDDRHVLSTSADSAMKEWDVEVGSCLHTFKGHRGIVYSVALHGNLAVTGSLDCSARIWDLRAAECIKSLTEHKNRVDAVLTDGKRIVTGSYDREIHIWDSAASFALSSSFYNQSYVQSLSFQGDLILSGAGDSNLRIFSLKKKSHMVTYTDHRDPIRCVVGDGKRLISADSSGKVIIRFSGSET